MGDRSPGSGPVLVAAIDLGTNAFRLLVAEIGADLGFTVLRVHRVIPRLGEGVSRTGVLSAAAMARALDALREIRAIVDGYPLNAVMAVATSAVREAANAGLFLRRVRSELGFDIEVISGAEEARRTWLGVQAGHSGRPIADAFVLDIGGGSTEIMHIHGGALLKAVSLNIGVVKLTEQWIHHDPPAASELAALDLAVRDGLREAEPLREGVDRCSVIGTAGTVTTAAALYLNVVRYDPSLTHDTLVPRAAIEEIAARLARMSAVERRSLPTLEPGREDVIVAGLAILRRALDLFGVDHVRVSEYGLREGLIVDWIERHCRLDGIRA